MWIPLLFKTLLNRCKECIRPYLWIYQQNNFRQKCEEVFPTCSLSCQSPQLCSYIIKPAFTGITTLTENIQCACAKLPWKRQELGVWSTSILTVFCQKSALANPRRVLPRFKLFFDFIINTRTCRQALHWQCSGRSETHRGSLSAAWLSASTFLSPCVSKEPGFRIFSADLHAHKHSAMSH